MTVSKIRVKLPTRFPSSVSVSSPLVLTKTGGNFAFSFDQSAFLTSFAKTGTGATLVLQTAPTLITPILGVATATSINAVTITAPATAATLTIPDGVTLTGPAASGTAMTLGNIETVTGVKTFGSAGAVGRLKVAGTTSGTTVLDANAVASGTLTFPAATDTLIGKATTDILTNKTYDTAGTGNVFKINGATITSNTGSGAVVLQSSPTITNPNIVGTATNDNAAAGSVGEYVESVIASGSAVSLSTGTGANVTSISLTAGDWDVDAMVSFLLGATTNITYFEGSLSQTTNTRDQTAGRRAGLTTAAFVPGVGTDFNLSIAPYRFSLSGTTTIYLVGLSNFTVSTNAAWGLLRARRVR